ncbi:Ig-like domain-containing protein [Citrobacter amalonaticus]|uniref:Ig-like domain-containing protein n=1 Tax=Citrobacter amalonaticus TaxID=35703 RepID=UPI00300C3215
MTSLVYSVTSDKNTLPDDKSLTATITAVIHDDTGAAAAEIPVTWTVTGAGTVDPASSTTDTNGVATTALTATGKGIISVKATTTDDTTGKSTSVLANDPLPAPVITGASNADGYLLDYYDLQLGVQMTIPHYVNAQPGDTVTFYWGNAYSHSFTLSDPAADLPYVIDVSHDCPPDCLKDGSYAVYYAAADAVGNISDSSALPVEVSNGGQTTPTLNAPQIPVAADGSINIADALNGVEVDVSYPSMAAGDFISLYWQALDTNGNPVQAATTSGSYTTAAGDTTHAFTIDSALFFPNSGNGYEGSVNAYYTVTPAGETTVQLSFTTSVTVDTRAPGVQG